MLPSNKYPALYRVLAENIDLSKEEIDILLAVKNRVGRREFKPEIVQKLIKLGLVAGDLSRAYVTDAGDTMLEKLKLKYPL